MQPFLDEIVRMSERISPALESIDEAWELIRLSIWSGSVVFQLLKIQHFYYYFFFLFIGFDSSQKQLNFVIN